MARSKVSIDSRPSTMAMPKSAQSLSRSSGAQNPSSQAQLKSRPVNGAIMGPNRNVTVT